MLSIKPWLEVYQESVRLPNGKVVPDYYGVKMPHYTAVFVLTEDCKIIILRNYRHAINEITLSMPGGMLDPGEDPIEGIKRELLEETGYVTKNWELLGSYTGNSTRGCGTYHLFFATGAYKIQEANSGDLEEIELLLWTKEELEKAIDTGQARSLGVLSLMLLGLRCMKTVKVPSTH